MTQNLIPAGRVVLVTVDDFYHYDVTLFRALVDLDAEALYRDWRINVAPKLGSLYLRTEEAGHRYEEGLFVDWLVDTGRAEKVDAVDMNFSGYGLPRSMVHCEVGSSS